MSLLYLVLALIAAQRAGELVLAARNTRRLRLIGGIEIDAAGYPWLVGLHAAWLASLALAVPADAAASWPLLALYTALQLIRLWLIATLGPRWTTRIIVVPDAPLVTRGPYRMFRHPNYAVVLAEIAILPLAFDAIGQALLFTAANAALLARRIRVEERALAPFRAAARANRVRRRPELERRGEPAVGTPAVAAAPRQPAAVAVAEAAAGRRRR